MQHTLSPSAHIAKVVLKANQVMGSIRRTMEFKSKENLRLYKSLVRPHLEYCQQAWRPYNQKDIDNIENVQRRMMKMILSLREDIYEERLVKVQNKAFCPFFYLSFPTYYTQRTQHICEGFRQVSPLFTSQNVFEVMLGYVRLGWLDYVKLWLGQVTVMLWLDQVQLGSII